MSSAERRARAGLTLIEIAFVLGIVATLVALSTTSYRSYIEGVRVKRAIIEVSGISNAVDAYEETYRSLPATLADAGINGLLDPWGNAYQYLPFPQAAPAPGSWGAGPAGPGGGGGAGGGGGGGGAGGAGGGGAGGGPGGGAGGAGGAGGGAGSVAQARKDRFLVPINSDFDLYSMGADGASVPALTAKASRDDIVRAADGAFVGLASQF